MSIRAKRLIKATLTGIVSIGILYDVAVSHGEEAIDIERLARFDPATQVAAVDTGSVRSFATVTVFVVRISAKKPDSKPAATPLREVRYLANCGARKLVLAAVSFIDANGEVTESHHVPPASLNYRAPDPGSAQLSWLEAACGAL